MRKLSLSLRLTAWVSAVFLCGFIVFGTVMWFNFAWALSQGRDKTLANRAQRLVDLLKDVRNDSETRLNSKFADFQEATPEGRLIQVFVVDGVRVLPPPSANAVRVSWPHVEPGIEQAYETIEFDGRPFRTLVRTVRVNEHSLRIFVAGQLDDNHHLMARFSDGLVWTISPLLILSTLAGYFVSRKALNPIDCFIESARKITIGSLSQRLPVPKSRDEMARLAETCNEMLERLETAVGQINRFTADASHELRSPISFIRTVAECELRRPNIDKECVEAFQDIVFEAEAASRLLEDMLTLARAEGSDSEREFQSVDFAVTVQSAVEKVRNVVRQSHDFSLAVGKTPSYVMGDETRLSRLVWILIDNAIKYTPRGGKVGVTLLATEREVELVVQDNGPGIPASALPRIFEGFFRVDPSRSQPEGVGLGLAIAKWIAEIHRGRITVESKEGLGSSFHVALPRLSETDAIRMSDPLTFSGRL